MSKALKILSRPQGNAEEYGRWAVNPYKGCSHNCAYCYLKKGVWANGLGGSTAQLKTGVVNEEHAYHLAMAEIIENRDEIIRDGGLFMTFTSDPMLHETRRLFIDIMRGCAKRDIPVTMLTKQTNLVLGIIKNLREDILYADENGVRVSDYDYHYLRNVALGWTLTGHDELEPNAPTNAQRIEEMASIQKYVCSDYIKTWASIEPVIDFDSSYKMITEALDAGCKHFKIGLLTNNTHLVRKSFQFGEHKFDAYKIEDCMGFITDVWNVTNGRATVYWKQSVRDLLGTVYTTAAVDEILNQSNAVGKDWNMFGDGVTQE